MVKTWLRIACAAAAIGACAQNAQAQCLTEGAVAEMTKAARIANPSDDKAFLKALDAVVRGAGKLDAGFQTLYHTEDISIILLSPYTLYRMTLESSLRKMEAIEQIRYKPEFTVGVSVSRIGAPDIEKIVLQRDGVTVEPIRNELKVEEMTTRMGAKTAIHNGEVYYACEAFAPTATMTVTAVPAVGQNITKTIKPAKLAEFR
jgi:hypothetical protein